MAVKKHTPLDYGAVNLGGAQFSVFICDTTPELPNGVAPMQFRKGDLAVTNDTQGFYVASSSTTWKRIDGAALVPAATVVNGTGFALGPVVGSSLNYAREDHSHGSVGHDSHTLLAGVTADQHHADVHGSAKHSGGILAVQDEGAGGGSVATVNFAGAGVSAAVVGTVATVTIPGATPVPSLFVAKTADESVAGSTSLQPDNELFVPMLANETWLVTGTFWCDCTNAAVGVKFGLDVPAGAVVDWNTAAAWAAATPAATLTLGSTASVAVAVSTAYSLTPIVLRFLVINASTAGNFQVRWAQNASSAQAMNVRKYSNLAALKVA